MHEESYAKDESVKEEPGDDEAEGEVDGDEEMPGTRLAIVAPDRLHVRPRTAIGATSIKLLSHSNDSKRLLFRNQQKPNCESCPR